VGLVMVVVGRDGAATARRSGGERISLLTATVPSAHVEGRVQEAPLPDFGHDFKEDAKRATAAHVEIR
jgi:hypothetical protein